MGTTAAVARLLGAGQRQAAAHTAVQAMWLGLAIGIPLAGLGYVFTEPLLWRSSASRARRSTYALRVLPHQPSRRPGAARLARIGRVPAWQQARADPTRGRGRSSNVVNLASSSCSSTGSATAWGPLRSRRSWCSSARQPSMRSSSCARPSSEGAGLRPDRHAIRSAGSDGWLLFLRTFFLRGAFFVLTAATARLGEVELAAQQIAMQIWTLLALALDSLEVAAQTLVGQALGGGSPEARSSPARRTLRWGTGVGCAAASRRLRAPQRAAVPLHRRSRGHLAGQLPVRVGRHQPTARRPGVRARRHPRRLGRPQVPGEGDGGDLRSS